MLSGSLSTAVGRLATAHACRSPRVMRLDLHVDEESVGAIADHAARCSCEKPLSGRPYVLNESFGHTPWLAGGC